MTLVERVEDELRAARLSRDDDRRDALSLILNALRDAQNYFVTIASGTYSGTGSLAMPLTLTNVSSIAGTITHYSNKHTNVDSPGLFNAFVLVRIPWQDKPAAVTNVRIIGN